MKQLDDLYRFVDEQGGLVHKEYPFWPCKSGCSVLGGKNCCDAALFPVSKTEWSRIKGAMHRLPQDERDEVRLKAREIYERYAMHTYKGDFRPLYEKHGGDDAPCPFLKNKKCLVFEDRPVISRAYGYFTFPTQAYWCTEVARVVKEHAVKKVPSWASIVARMSKFVRGPSKPLAAWVVEG